MDVGHGVVEIVVVLKKIDALAIAAHIECANYDDVGEGIVEGRCGHAETGQRGRAGRVGGTCRCVGEVEIGVLLSQAAGQPVKSESCLVQNVVVDHICVCE